MNQYRVYLLVLIIAAGLTFRSVWAYPAMEGNPTLDLAVSSSSLQIVPTETPDPEIDEVLMTSPALLQVIILLGIVAVLIIFIGVWINRHNLDSR